MIPYIPYGQGFRLNRTKSPVKLKPLNEWKGLPLDMRLINFRAIIG